MCAATWRIIERESVWTVMTTSNVRYFPIVETVKLIRLSCPHSVHWLVIIVATRQWEICVTFGWTRPPAGIILTMTAVIHWLKRFVQVWWLKCFTKRTLFRNSCLKKDRRVFGIVHEAQNIDAQFLVRKWTENTAKYGGRPPEFLYMLWNQVRHYCHEFQIITLTWTVCLFIWTLSVYR